MKRLLLIWYFVISFWFPTKVATSVEVPKVEAPKIDIRVEQLNTFFAHYKCPTPYYSQDYIIYADQYNIDFRLLPSISIAESTCGRHDCFHTANWWGWRSCRGIKFATVPDGIKFVSEQLASNHYYAGKSNYKKMRSYNPNPEYAPKIIKMMLQINETKVD